MKQGRIDIITMGCSKNLVDSERLSRRLEALGYEPVHDSDDVCGEYVVVNTCGFIGDAKEQSIDMILRLAEAKAEGKIGSIAVMGCLSQRYPDELKEEIPEVDYWYGKFDWADFITRLPRRKPEACLPLSWQRNLSTPPYTAYLKISEGCDRMCAYCAIPLITGRHKSRPIEEILDEVRELVASGVKEFNIIAQDLSAYGHDLYGESRLARLVDEIAAVPGVEWIRLHYAYPADFPYDVLEVMRRRDNVCKYLDIALQHISDHILDSMRRHVDKETTLRLIDRIRREVPGIKLRTTLMTGFPGETEEDFRQLLEFVEETRFDRLGGFAYCEEDDTWAARHLEDDVPQEVKEARLEAVMELQERISLEIHEHLVGTEQKVLIEIVDGDLALGRTQWDSPEVDPVVEVRLCRNASPGDFVTVRIESAEPFRLSGRQI